MKQKWLMSLLCALGATLLSLAAAGCSGGGSSAGGGTTVTSQVSITITPSSGSVPSGGQMLFTVTITGSTNTSYMASVTPTSAGMFSTSSAAFTASLLSSDTATKIVVTSSADTTKSAEADITVKARTITVGTVVKTLRSDGQSLTGVFFTGAGIIEGDLFCWTGPTAVQCNPFGAGTGTSFSFGFPFDDGGYRPRRIDVLVKSADGLVKSNVLHIAFTGDKDMLAFFGNPPPYLAYLDQANGNPSPPNNNGFADVFGLNGTMTASKFVGTLLHSIAADNTTSYIVVSGGNVMKADGSSAGVSPQGSAQGFVADSAARNGSSCFLQPTNPANPSASCFDLTQSAPAINTVPVGVEPWSIDMSAACGELDFFTYDRQGQEVFRHSVSGMSLKSSGLLSGFTPADTVSHMAPAQGGWYVKAFQNSCTLAVMGAILNADGSVSFGLALMNGNPVSQTGTLISLPSTSYRLAVDETHNRFAVAWFDAASGLTKFVVVDASTGVLTNLLATSDLIVAGFGASSDGKTIYACGVDVSAASPFPVKCEFLTNN